VKFGDQTFEAVGRLTAFDPDAKRFAEVSRCIDELVGAAALL
jgi:hypothetical protein